MNHQFTMEELMADGYFLVKWHACPACWSFTGTPPRPPSEHSGCAIKASRPSPTPDPAAPAFSLLPPTRPAPSSSTWPVFPRRAAPLASRFASARLRAWSHWSSSRATPGRPPTCAPCCPTPFSPPGRKLARRYGGLCARRPASLSCRIRSPATPARKIARGAARVLAPGPPPASRAGYVRRLLRHAPPQETSHSGELGGGPAPCAARVPQIGRASCRERV